MCSDKAPGDTISTSGVSFPSGAVIVVVVAGALFVVVVDVARAVVVGAAVVVVVDDDVTPVDAVVSSSPAVVVDAPTPASAVLVVADSAVPNEHPAPSSAKATTTSFHMRITPRYYVVPKLPTSERSAFFTSHGEREPANLVQHYAGRMSAPHPALLSLLRGDEMPPDIRITPELVASAEERGVAALIAAEIQRRGIDVDQGTAATLSMPNLASTGA
jgi:hypothetical protein